MISVQPPAATTNTTTAATTTAIIVDGPCSPVKLFEVHLSAHHEEGAADGEHARVKQNPHPVVAEEGAFQERPRRKHTLLIGAVGVVRVGSKTQGGGGGHTEEHLFCTDQIRRVNMNNRPLLRLGGSALVTPTPWMTEVPCLGTIQIHFILFL